MALITAALLFFIYTVGECAAEREYRVAAPSLIRLCNDIKHKPLFCLICNGFDFSCFSPTTVTPPPTTTTLTPSTTPSTTTTTTANNGGTEAPAEV